MAVVHAVFFATGATQFDFQSHVHFGHARQVFRADLNVLFQRLFRQVDHVRREQWLTGCSEVFFARVQQTVDPRQQFLRAVVSVQDNRNTIVLSHLVNVVCARDCAQDCRTLRNVSFHAFTCDKRSTAVGELNDYRRFNFCCGFQYGVDRVGTDAVNRWQSKVVFFCYLEHLLNVITSDHARFYEIKNFRHVASPVSSALERGELLKAR